ncbi:SGNH hydrolase domain-containing protein [Rathayibacter sp. VKM Ac-2754]|uniref:SGNH hydrolase domain-containing protein n=1 Tax=Rathayibacter sp. VKM Ac-2754 TaxID=2609251 RepID=UPI0022857DED|nr:SGNH hydrolase domain-containing protein [Rathayibacter sp. VKM Ac-2754]
MIRWPKLKNAPPRATLFGALAASVVISLGATASFAYSNSRHLSVEVEVASAITAPPKPTDVVPRNLEPSLRQASSDQPELYEDGCHRDFASSNSEPCLFGDPGLPQIALFGDSHAAQWFPAVIGAASELGYSVETFTKSSCPSVDIEVRLDGVPYSECSAWRDGVLQELQEAPPALVIVANYGRADTGTSGSDYIEGWEAGLERTIRAIPSPVAVMADTPDLIDTPAVCLSAHLAEAEVCGLEREKAVDQQIRGSEADAAAQNDAVSIDLTDYLCSVDWCPPIVGNTLIYRDAHHITATFSAHLATPLGDALEPMLRAR